MIILDEPAASLQTTFAAKWNKNKRLFAKLKCMFCCFDAAQIRIATFALHFLDHSLLERRNTYNICETAAKSVKNYENTFSMRGHCELNELCHFWEWHHLQPRQHAHQPCGRQTVCTSVRAGRCAPPVRNCVLFLVSVVTGRVQGPSQSESQWLRFPVSYCSVSHRSGPTGCTNSRCFKCICVKRGPKKRTETVQIVCTKTQHAF